MAIYYRAARQDKYQSSPVKKPEPPQSIYRLLHFKLHKFHKVQIVILNIREKGDIDLMMNIAELLSHSFRAAFVSRIFHLLGGNTAAATTRRHARHHFHLSRHCTA